MADIIKASDIRTLMRAKCPELKFIWCFDRRYYLPTAEEVAKPIAKITVADNYKSEVLDCDDFALIVNGQVKQYVHKYYDTPWAFGECCYFEPFGGVHSVNIFVDNNKMIQLYDARDHEVKAYTNENIYWVRL